MRRQLFEDGVLGAQPDLGRRHRAAISQRTRDALAAKAARGADGVPTARGKTSWYAATIEAVVASDNAVALA